MSMYFREDTRVTVWKIDPIENTDNYSVQFSSGRKKKGTEEYINSGWGYVKFIGPAATKAKDLEPKDRIVLLVSWISKEPYLDKEGNKKYPKNPQITVWDFDWYKKSDSYQDQNEPPVVDEVETDDDLPF